MEATEIGKEGGREGGRGGLPSLRVEKSSTESMNLMSAPAMKLIGRHPNCVWLEEISVGRKRDGVFLVFEYCEVRNWDLSDVISLKLVVLLVEAVTIFLALASRCLRQQP